MLTLLALALLPLATQAADMVHVFDPEAEPHHEHAPHHCIHDKIAKLIEHQVDEQVYDAYEEAARKRQSGVPTAPLRVNFDTFNLGAHRQDCRQAGQQVVVNGEQITCRAQDILDQATKNVLLRVLADMKSTVGDMLAIVRASSYSLRNSRWCFDPSIDISRYTTPSNDFDVMMMVTSWPTSGNTVAWAGACRSDQYGRPVAGHMNYGPGAVGGRPYKMIYATALHELFHALGFSGERFKNVQKVTLGDGQSGTKVATIVGSPRVRAEVRAHYGCATAVGMEIEDDGGGGSVGSHWEQRVAGPEVESPSVASSAGALGPLVSRITLALFEDLGFYYPDYRKVTGNYAYGRGQGCGFIQRPHRERATQYQCPRTQRSNKCNPDGTGFSSCQWYNYGQAIGKFEQPDTSAPTQGGNEFSDYAVEAQSYQSCRGGTLPTDNGQNGGPNAICVMNSVVANGWRRDTLGAGCFELKCPGGSGYTPPSPTAAAPTAAPTRPPAGPTSAPSGGNTGNNGPTLRQFAQCESCNDQGGRWCDGGWLLPDLNRYGVCIDPKAESCPSWAPNAVDDSDSCYPDCNYGSQYLGSCRGASYCESVGGIRVSTVRGATGCERQPAQYITCCITKRRVGKREVVEEKAQEQAAVEVVDAEESRKRQTAAQLRIGNQWYSCPAAGGQISVTGSFSGAVQCPSLEDACCASKNFCSGRGQCYHGNCVCQGAFQGDSCEQATAAPSGFASSTPPRVVDGQYLLEEEMPRIDARPKTDDELGRKPVPLPDDFGLELGMDGLDSFFKNGTSDPTITDPSGSAGLHPGVIAAIVIVIILIVAVAAGLVVFFQRRSRTTQA